MKGGTRYGAGRKATHVRTCDVSRIHVRDLRAKGIGPDSIAATLDYRYRFADGERDVHQRIALEWTPCRFGGLRAWFRCPRCQRRCAILYAHGWPACRTCARLAYPSTRCDAIDRSWRRTWALERRLDWQQDHYGHGPKPKGMHATTFARLRAAWWREAELRDALLCAFLASMEARFPGVQR